MNIPTPHTCTIKRTPFSASVYQGVTTVASAVPCLFSPYQAETKLTPLGPTDDYDYVLFVEYSTDIQRGDTVVNDSTNEEFVVIRPPLKFDMPIGWSNHHIEVYLRVSKGDNDA